MANTRLLQLPNIVIPTTGTSFYLIENGQSYQGAMDNIADVFISEYGLLTTSLPSSLMSTGNAELILNGLNSAPNALLSVSKIDFAGSYFFFDIDGGTFYDTYINTSTYDGGNF